jgi:uncharacterized protein YciI
VYIVFLKFGAERARAKEHMPGHAAFIERGVAEGVFVLVGSLEPSLGGALLVHGPTRAELDALLVEDPFVAHGVVSVEVHTVSPAGCDARLAFLKDGRDDRAAQRPCARSRL